ncbi:hexose transporter-like protein [Microdochium nivale]|nr:hexose transporter-like protein [Microdochium nivale]
MAIFKPPRRLQSELPAKPSKGCFYFAGREFQRRPWWRMRNLRRLYFFILVLILSNTANGFDGSMMNGLQSLSYWQEFFNYPKGAILGLFNASMSLGSLIALPMTPYLIDYAGRRSGVAIGCVIMLVAVGLQSGAQNFGMFVAARMLLGFGDSIVLGSAPLLIAEIAHPQDRATVVTLFGASYHSGAFIASWVTYGTLQIQSDWSWRLPSLLQSICSVFILVVIFFIPESPRWLMDKDQHEKALQVFTYYHAEGDETDEFVQLEFAEVKAAIDLEKHLGQSNWSDFFKTKGNRKRLGILTAIGFFSQWSGNGLISYYLKTVMDQVGITDPQTQLGINGGMKTQALLENFILSFYVDKIGRRPMYLISTIGTFLTFNAWTIISARFEIAPASQLGYAFVFMIFMYSLFYDFKNGLLASYSTEILPYHLRAKGYAFLNFAVSLALFFNQYVNAIALDALQWRYYIVYCVFLAFEIVIIYCFIVETRYTPLEEIARFFDGDDAVDIREVANADVKEKHVAAHEVVEAEHKI